MQNNQVMNTEHKESFRYPEHFKREIAEAVINNRYSIANLATRHQIPATTISRWAKEYRYTTNVGRSPSEGLQDEVHQLKLHLDEAARKLEESNSKLLSMEAYVSKLERTIIKQIVMKEVD